MANLDAIADGDTAPRNRWKPFAYIATGISPFLVAGAIFLLASGYTENDFIIPFVAWIGLLLAGSRANVKGWTRAMAQGPSPELRRATKLGEHVAWMLGIVALAALTWPFDPDKPISIMPYTLLGLLAIVAATREAITGVYLVWFTDPQLPNDDFW